MLTMKYLAFLLCLILFIASCTEKDSVKPDIDEEIKEVEYDYTSPAKYNLNIVYFLPADVSERNESHKRLSEILLHGQQFFKKNMTEYDFTDKTFNLLDELHNRVKIIYINAHKSTGNYKYNGGGGKIIEEVDAYFLAHPQEKSSDHTLIFTPVLDQDNADVPFYGLGRYCFALDYNDMDVKYFREDSKRGRDATKYIGGLLHELGHGLNLPHNQQKVSEVDDLSKGTSLMGAGNFTYGATPTFLTRSSCAILNNCQVFSKSTDQFYTGASLEIKNIEAIYQDGKLKLSGSFETDQKVNHIAFYNDPADNNSDYDAVTWAAPVLGDNGFEMEMPINELFKKQNTPYVLKLRFCHVNGEITSYSYAYSFVDDIPVIEFGDRENFDRGIWSVIDFSSQENGEVASYILDGDKLTFWHSRWSQNATSYPHYITVDMGESLDVSGFSFLQRDGQRKVKDIEILVSVDGEKWESQGNFELKSINTLHHIMLPFKTQIRYFKVNAKSAFDGNQFAAMADIMCF
jgi:hypothetical protein